MVRRCLLFLVMTWALVNPGQAAAFVEVSPGEQPAGPAPESTHVVQRGETLFSIAEFYGSTVDALAHVNGLADPTVIYVGQQLTIPNTAVGFDQSATVSYVVQAGDFLAHIARRYGVSWQCLARVNGLMSPGGLQTGQVISVPIVEGLRESGGRLHYVRDGETLFSIALRYGVAPWRLVEANLEASRPLIYRGQVVVIPGQGESGLPAPFETVDARPLPVQQGESVVIAVNATEPVTLTGRLLEQEIRFVEQQGVYYGLAGVHVFTEPGSYDLTLTAVDVKGSALEVVADIVVEADQFGYERIPASPSLLDPAVVAPERELLDALRPTFTEERMWAGQFQRPCGGTVSSYFGARRAYNEGPYTSYHAGVDLRGATGTPVHAPAAGTVVLVDSLAVRGNALMLDHGWGVLTGYWHLSSIEVEEGQVVEQGEVIARVGNSGLSTGSHLHWEMWVGGVNVNPLQWLECFYPWLRCTDSPAP